MSAAEDREAGEPWVFKAPQSDGLGLEIAMKEQADEAGGLV